MIILSYLCQKNVIGEMPSFTYYVYADLKRSCLLNFKYEFIVSMKTTFGGISKCSYVLYWNGNKKLSKLTGRINVHYTEVWTKILFWCIQVSNVPELFFSFISKELELFSLHWLLWYRKIIIPKYGIQGNLTFSM